MPTIARGNLEEVYVPSDSSVTITPGDGGYVKAGFAVRQGMTAVPPREIRAATTLSVSGGTTLFLEAINTDATYTSPVSGDGRRPAGTALVLDARATYLPLTVAGATTISVSGTTPGAEAQMVVVANGANVPTISGADEWATSFGYLNTNGVPNLLTVWHDGVARRFSWSRQAVPAAIDVTAPTISAAAVNGATLTITWSEAIANTPSAAAFSVVGAGGVTQAPSAASQFGATTTLTLDTPAVNANTVTLSVSAGAALDASDNASAAITGQAVTNNTAAAGIGSSLSLTTRTALNVSGANYVGVTGTSGFGAFGRPAGTIAANTSGWIGVRLESASAGAVIMALHNGTNPGAGTTLLCQAQISTSGNAIRRGQGTAAGDSTTVIESLISAGVASYYRLGRTAGGVYTIDKSTDTGATWTTIYTFVGVSSTATLYPIIYTTADNTVYDPRQSNVA